MKEPLYLNQIFILNHKIIIDMF